MPITIHKDEIVKLGKQGLSYRAIREKLGCSIGTISHHLGDGQKDKKRTRVKKRRELKDMTAKKSTVKEVKRKNEKRGREAFPKDFTPPKPKDRKRNTISIEDKMKDKVEVRLDSRTWVMTKPGYDIEALRKKYLKK